MYQYWGFGLHISSEIEFPELYPTTFENADVHISMGKVPLEITSADVVKKVRVSISPTEYLQKIEGIANYYVANGNEIRIEAQPDIDEKSIRLFMLSNAMAAVLHQRNMIPMHASAVYHNGGIILFCGHSGAGKSTIATSLQLKGYKVFSDDVCVLKTNPGNENVISALPSYPMMKLWADSFARVGLEMGTEEEKLRPQLAKYARFYHDEFDVQPMPVTQVFILSTDNLGEDVEISKMPSIASFNALQRNTYRHVQMNAMQKRNIHFSMVSKLTAAVPVYKLSRPQNGNTIAKIIELIEANLPING